MINYIEANSRNELAVEGHSSVELADAYGTPLFVLSENAIRSNFRRFDSAFRSRYANDVVVCVGLKANYGLAARRIIVQEGGGGDVFGLGELYVALATGTDPRKVVVNGVNKGPAVIEAAVLGGAIINIDGLDELSEVEAIQDVLGRDTVPFWLM